MLLLSPGKVFKRSAKSHCDVKLDRAPVGVLAPVSGFVILLWIQIDRSQLAFCTIFHSWMEENNSQAINNRASGAWSFYLKHPKGCRSLLLSLFVPLLQPSGQFRWHGYGGALAREKRTLINYGKHKLASMAIKKSLAVSFSGSFHREDGFWECIGSSVCRNSGANIRSGFSWNYIGSYWGYSTTFPSTQYGKTNPDESPFVSLAPLFKLHCMVP